MQQLPREKLASYGPSALEDHELLAIILGRGTCRENVFSLSQRIFQGFDREEIISEHNIGQLSKNLNLGFVQSSQIMAFIELGKRFFKPKSTVRQIQTLDDAYQIVKNMQFLKKEYVRGLYLNTRYRIIHDEIISIGSLDANIIHPREIFRPAIEYSAYSIILAHNHPSGDPSPSSSDLEVHQNLVKIGNLIQIPILEHLIIGENSYKSLNSKRL